MDNNTLNYDQNNVQPFNNQPVNNNQMLNEQPIKKNNKPIIKVLAIIGGITVGIIVLFIVIFAIVSKSSNKLVCKSNEGNITIMYNDKTITGYVTTGGISYDMDQQKEVAEQIGISNYISQFITWFETNTTGTCTNNRK